MRIGILGPLEVSADGRPVEVGGARLRALLTVLALEAGRVIAAERLIDDLWEESPPAAAGNALQSLISRLRAIFDQCGADRALIESRAGGYRLALPRDAVDAHDFETAVLRARRTADPQVRSAELRAALTLWRGPALADVAGLPFADGPVARLEGMRRAALEERIDADLALGRVAELIPELEALSAADPLREPLRVRLMRALYAAGRQAEALAVYDDARRALGEALGVDPSPDLERVHLAVLRQDPALLISTTGGTAPDGSGHGARPPAAANGAGDAAQADGAADDGRPVGNLRTRLTSFIGRDGDLKRIGKLLAESRLVTLTGPGGAGKTRLALESGDRMPDRMADGVWFIALASIVDPAELSHAVLSALGLGDRAPLAVSRSMRTADLSDPLDRLAVALAGKRLLLILDNCEHLLDAAAALADRLLADCPGVRILTTSREPLGMTGESLWPVEPLPLPPPDAEPDDAMTYPAIRLLADRGAAVRPGFAVNEANVRHVVRICRALDGIPLAIELAAARLRVLSPAQIAYRLDDRFRLLSGGSRTALPRHQTLRAVVEWSWELLDDAERVLWRRLSVLSGGATLESAEAVCAGPGLPGDEVLDALTALVDKSLVDLTGESEPRYRMLETIRAYGTERLAEAGEEAAVRRAHAEYFIELAERAEPKLFGRDQVRWLDRLTGENDNLQAALRWSIDAGDAALAVRFCAALVWYWWIRGHRAEGSTLVGEVLEMPGLPDEQPTAVAAAIGAVTSFGGPRDPEEIKSWIRRAREISRNLVGEPLHPVLRLLEPVLAVVTGMGLQALDGLQPMLGDRDPWVRALAYFIHGQVSFNFGRADGVEGDFKASMEGFRAAGDRWGMSVALASLAEVRSLRGEHRAAVALCEESLELWRELRVDGSEGVAYVRMTLATQLALLGEQRRARELVEEARQVAERTGAPEELVGVYFQLGEFARREGDVAEARRMLDRATTMIGQINCPPQFRAMIIATRGLLAADEGDLPAARTTMHEALGQAVDAIDYPIIAHVLTGHADLADREGDRVRAAELLGTADGIRGTQDKSFPVALRLAKSLRAGLGADPYEAAYQRGHARTLDDVLELFGLTRPSPPTF